MAACALKVSPACDAEPGEDALLDECQAFELVALLKENVRAPSPRSGFGQQL